VDGRRNNDKTSVPANVDTFTETLARVIADVALEFEIEMPAPPSFNLQSLVGIRIALESRL
jgi:hypothetical protein